MTVPPVYPSPTREIPLTQGKVAIVDEADYEWLSQWKWYYSGGYACRAQWVSRGKRRMILMHRAIAGDSDERSVDHANRDRLDNRRCNLRRCTTAQNTQNQGLMATNTSGYKGVHWDRFYQRWTVSITANNRAFHLGRFDRLSDAVRCYNEAALKHHGAFAWLNPMPDSAQDEEVHARVAHEEPRIPGMHAKTARRLAEHVNAYMPEVVASASRLTSYPLNGARPRYTWHVIVLRRDTDGYYGTISALDDLRYKWRQLPPFSESPDKKTRKREKRARDKATKATGIGGV